MNKLRLILEPLVALIGSKPNRNEVYTKMEVYNKDEVYAKEKLAAVATSGMLADLKDVTTYAIGYKNRSEAGSALGESFNMDANGVDGSYNTATGNYSHAEGCITKAEGTGSHAEGSYTTASGDYSHAEGSYTTASGDYSHAEGSYTTASGDYSHAEGSYTTASENCSHAEGQRATASGFTSHAEGFDTIAAGAYQHVQGRYNIKDADGVYAHIVGNGQRVGNSSTYYRSNAHTLDWSGNAWYAGTVEGTGMIVKSSTEGSTKRFQITVDDTGAITATEIAEETA